MQLDYLRRTSAAATGVALIVVTDTGENSIVVIPGANALLEPDDIASVPIAAGDVVLSQFEIPLVTIQQFFTQARTSGATTILNPAPAQRCARELLALADVLILNETELAFFADTASVALSSLDTIAAAARRLRARSEQVIIATLGALGALAITRRTAGAHRGTSRSGRGHHRRWRYFRRGHRGASGRWLPSRTRATRRQHRRRHLRAAIRRGTLDSHGG